MTTHDLGRSRPWDGAVVVRKNIKMYKRAIEMYILHPIFVHAESVFVLGAKSRRLKKDDDDHVSFDSNEV